MNVFKHVESKITAALESLKSGGTLPQDLDLAGVEVQEPRDPSHGDVASNAAMVLSKRAGMIPRDIAAALADALEGEGDFETVSVAGPGFLNIKLKDTIWSAVLGDVLKAGMNYGACNLGAGESAHVEFVSANPTGPMHIGHCRGAVLVMRWQVCCKKPDIR
jgi:arginyl-tRNA synthetase